VPYVAFWVRLGQSHDNRKVRKDSRLSDFFTVWTGLIQTFGPARASKGQDKGRKAVWKRF
jgi:hypothetical protein